MAGLCDRSFYSGLLEKTSYDEVEDRVVVETVQDVEPILDRNKALYNAGDGYSPSREWRRVADIPLIVVLEWLREGINVFRREDWPKVAARLQDPEYRYLRTAPGDPRKRPTREFLRASTPRVPRGGRLTVVR